MMTMQCLQKQSYIIATFRCFRTSLTVVIFAGDMNAIQILLWHDSDVLTALASWLWITLTCLNVLST